MSGSVGTAVMTGHTAGVGPETALGLARASWRVIITGRNPYMVAFAKEQLIRAGDAKARRSAQAAKRHSLPKRQGPTKTSRLLGFEPLSLPA